MIYPIYTELTECRDCYKCVRHCPVKAIQVKDGSAVVVQSRCIYCGTCVGTCPTHAKKVRNDVDRVRQFIKERKRVLVALAPSFSSEFPGDERKLFSALMKLGFAGISETAIGAALVNAVVSRYAAAHDNRCPFISTACPSVVQLVKKYYPQLNDKLMDCPSPLQCQAAYLRHLYGEDIGIVFVGPCIAKKIEADQTPGYPDFALTFKELHQWFELEGIDLESQPETADITFMPARAGASTLYPVEGGMIASLPWGKDPFQTSAVALSGAEQVRKVLDELKETDPQFLEMLACEGGCVNGPGSDHNYSPANRKSNASRFTRERVESGECFTPPEEFVDMLCEKGYGVLNSHTERKLENYGLKKHSKQEIDQALYQLGKKSKADEINCGGCGYNTCREMAAAYLDGMAEPEMCVTMMRKEAESKVDVLLRTLPMGVVIVDDKLRINDCNAGFLQLFTDIEFVPDMKTISKIVGLPLSHFLSFTDKFEEQFVNQGVTSQYRMQSDDKFLRVTFFNVESQHLVGALFEDVTSPTVRRETVVKKAESVIQKSLNTVQQIASLLGENAADTEIMLNSLIDAFKVPNPDGDETLVRDEQQDLI